MEGLVKECNDDFENHYPNGKVPVNKKWFQVPTVLGPALKVWFEVEMKMGKSVSWFRDWYSRHPNREVLLNARENKRISKV
jgi:hypothetical protein